MRVVEFDGFAIGLPVEGGSVSAIRLDADDELGNLSLAQSLAEVNVLGANRERDCVPSQRTFYLRVLAGGSRCPWSVLGAALAP